MQNYRLPNATTITLRHMKVRPGCRAALEKLIAVAEFHGWTAWTWNPEWAETHPEWEAVWKEFGHLAGPEEQLEACSETFRAIRATGELDREWAEDDRYPLDLGDLQIDTEGNLSREDYSGYPNQSDLLAQVLSDFVEPGGIVEVWTGDVAWGYQIKKPGEILGLTLAWVTTFGREIVTEIDD